MRNAFIQGAVALLSLAPASSLSAGDVTYGVQAGIAFPAGPIREDGFKTGGPSLGVHALVDLGGGHALRPRLEWTRLRGERTGTDTEGTPVFVRSTNSLRTFSIGADYLFHPQGRIEGFYVLAGLSLDANRYVSSGTVTALAGASTAPLVQNRSASSQVKPAFHLGLGWQFNRNVGLELRHGISRMGGYVATVTGTDHGVPISEPMPVAPETLRKTTLSLVVRF